MPTTLTANPTGSVVPPELLRAGYNISNDGSSRVHVALGRPATLADMAIAPMMLGFLPCYQRGVAVYALSEGGSVTLRISSPPASDLFSSPWITPGAVAQAGAAGLGGGGSLGAAATYVAHG